MVRIIQLNLGRSVTATSHLELEINKYKTKIALIQEPNVVNNKVRGFTSGKIINYVGVMKENQSVRSAIWIENDFHKSNNCQLLGEFTDRDQTTMQITIEQENKVISEIIICSVYMPHNSIQDNRTIQIKMPINEKLNNLIKHCKRKNLKLIIGCDSNAHNTIWGNKNNNARGNNLLNYLMTEDLHLHNTGDEFTYSQNDAKTIIDLTITNHGARNLIDNWKVVTEEIFSDHRAISYDLKILQTKDNKIRIKKRTDWMRFKIIITNNISKTDVNIENSGDLDDMAMNIEELLISTYKKCCKEREIKRTKTVWFTDKLSSMRKELRKVYHRLHYKKSHTKPTAEALGNEYKEKKKLYLKECWKEKNRAWKKKIAQVEGAKEIARMQKLMENTKPPEITTLINSDGEYTDNDEETIKELMQTHFPKCEVITAEKDTEVITTSNDNDVNKIKEIDEIINIESVKWAIDSFGAFKSPGEDGIFPALLQKPLDIIAPYIVKIFKYSLSMNYIPKPWRGTLITFIPKPGKNTYLKAKSYRPISLMSFILKAMEKILDNHIREKVLDKNPLSKDQHAYQKGKSTESALHHLVHRIEKALEHKEIAITTFIDIEGAFDNTDFSIIRKSLEKKGISKLLTEWITSMLRNRNISASNQKSNIKYNPTRGCPQGGCLSPLLWCMVVDELLNTLKQNKFDTVGYADDIAIICSNKKKFEGTVCDRTNKAMEIIENWCKTSGLKVNPDKAEIIKFSSDNKNELKKEVEIFGNKIKQVKSVKYLGIILDEKLLWNKQIEYISDKGRKTLYAARKMVSKSWGLSPNAKLWLYKQIVLPRITYGCVAWWTVSKIKTKISKLNTLQRTAMLMITGATRSTPSTALEALLNLLPMELLLEETALKSCIRLQKNQTWINLSQGGSNSGHKKIEKKAKNIIIAETDWCATTLGRNNKYKTVINDRNNWKYGLYIENNEDCWYTDGSVKNNKSAFGIYNPIKQIKISERISDHGTIMQAETIGVNECTKIILSNNEYKKDIVILTDSQATIKALSKQTYNTQTIKLCKENLNLLGRDNKVTIAWVPAHTISEGNKEADRLAVEGSKKESVRIEVGESSCAINKAVENIYKKEAISRWHHTNTDKQLHARKYIRGYEEFKTRYLMKCNIRDTRVITGLLTGHAMTNDYLFKIKKAVNSKCRHCNNPKETVEHWIKECPKLEHNKRIIFLNGLVDDRDIHYRNLLGFAKIYKEEIYESFFPSIEEA